MLQVWIEALHITHRPVCWVRMSGLLSGGTKDTQAARLTHAINMLKSPEAQTLAQCHRIITTSALPAITVQVCALPVCPLHVCPFCAYSGALATKMLSRPSAALLSVTKLSLMMLLNDVCTLADPAFCTCWHLCWHTDLEA